MQNFFWRVILKVPESCPKVALRCEPKMLGIKWRVWQEKLLLLMRIRNHEESVLCRQIYEEAKAKGWPGLGQEATAICQTLNIPDDNTEFVSKTVIKDAVFNHHQFEMKAEINKMSKLEPIKADNFLEVQDYFMDKSIENGRLSFKIRSQMLDIPGNFKNKYRNQKEKLKCQHCQSDQVMTQSHCLDCPAWTDIRKNLDLTKIEDLVKFFQKLLAERAKPKGSDQSRPHCTAPAPRGDSCGSDGCS